MSEKRYPLRTRVIEELDFLVSRLSGNKITEQKLGKMTVIIHKRRRGEWTKAYTSHSRTPIRGKTHDIVYTLFDGQIERKRLGNMAKEQRKLKQELKASPAT